MFAALTTNKGVGGVPETLKIENNKISLSFWHLENWFSLSKYTIDLPFTKNRSSISKEKLTK